MVCGVDLQPYNFTTYALPSTYNGCNPNSATGFSACHSDINGTAVCDSCGSCGTGKTCAKDADCASGQACLINTACSGGAAVCLPINDNCWS